MTVLPICHPPGRFVAVVDATGTAEFSAPLEALGEEHPTMRFVALMCLYAAAVQLGDIPGPYSDHRASHWARCHAMPVEDFCRWADRPDAQLAAYFHVPVDQVQLRRGDADCVALHLERQAALPPPAPARPAPAFRRTLHIAAAAPGHVRRFRAARPRRHAS